jgi:hypothetical protein
MAGSKAGSLIETITNLLVTWRNPIKDVFFTDDGQTFEQLHEGRWFSGRFDRNIRFDQPTPLQGHAQPHAHVFGRNSRNQIVVVNFDGTGSHGTKGHLHKKDAKALRDAGFSIRSDNMVEWTAVEDAPQLLLE